MRAVDGIATATNCGGATATTTPVAYLGRCRACLLPLLESPPVWRRLWCNSTTATSESCGVRRKTPSRGGGGPLSPPPPDTAADNDESNRTSHPATGARVRVGQLTTHITTFLYCRESTDAIRHQHVLGRCRLESDPRRHPFVRLGDRITLSPSLGPIRGAVAAVGDGCDIAGLLPPCRRSSIIFAPPEHVSATMSLRVVTERKTSRRRLPNAAEGVGN
jgi:hypothetical protein